MELHLYWISTITYAFLLSVILFSDIRATKQPGKLEKSYRNMAIWVIFFCLQDTFWGMCQVDIIRNDAVFFNCTALFHVSTSITTFFWLKYVLEYLGDRIRYKHIYLVLDGILIGYEFIIVIVNYFNNILFNIVDGKYVTGAYRPITFFNQYIVYFVIGVIMLVSVRRNAGKDFEHYRSVFLFALAPILLGVFQLLFPEGPFYSLGYFLGCFIIHIFVITRDREVYLNKETQYRKIAELNRELEEKQAEIDEQFEIFKSIVQIFDYINMLDFDTCTAYRLDVKDSVSNAFDIVNDPHTNLNKEIASRVDEQDYDRFWTHTDLSTLEYRMKGKKFILEEFKYADGRWIRAMYIRIGDSVNEPIKRVAYTLRNITDDRKREEQVYSAMANLLYSLHIFDLENDSMERLIESDIIKRIIGNEESAQQMSNIVMKATCKEEYLDIMMEFVDLSTISKRLEGKRFISCEFVGKFHGWTRLTFMPIEIKDKQVKKLVVTTQIIDSEKSEMINLVYKSSTDELTGLYNRRMYEEELTTIDAKSDLKNLVIIVLDVNGLKPVNDTLGHTAGDELIIGAGKCMGKSFNSLGKIYRTGGDEFVAILRCDEDELAEALMNFDQNVEDFTGRLIDRLSISYGYAASVNYPKLSVRSLVSEADKRMYEAKAAYYRQEGINRRRG